MVVSHSSGPIAGVGVLGVTHLVRDGVALPLSAAKQRRLLAYLALHRGRPVSIPDLIGALWDDRPPPAAHATLQGYVADLRRRLEPDRGPRDTARVLRTDGASYVLDLPRSALDVTAFADTIASAMGAAKFIPDCLRPSVTGDAAELEAALAELDAALDAWGVPFADLDDVPEAIVERHRLDELRTRAQEHSAMFKLALGKHEAAVDALERLAYAHPLREHVWGLLAVALYRGNRQAEALLALKGLRDRLSEELGVDPALSTRTLYDDILRQEGTLAPNAPSPVHPSKLELSPLIGREPEFQRLLALVDDVRSGRGGRAAGILGESGIGKSRLARAVADEAERLGFVVVRGAALEDDSAPPLWPLHQALEQLARRTHTRLEVQGDPGQETRESGTFQLREHLREFLVTASRSAPVALVLEDVHWADLATLHALRHLVDRVESMPVLILVTRLPGTFDAVTRSGLSSAIARVGVRIHLDGLSAPALQGVVINAAGVDLDDAEAGRLHDRTGGNPFFAILLARSGDLTGDHLPGQLLDVLDHQLAKLPAATLETLRIAALLGDEFDPAMVAEVGGDDPWSSLDRLADALAVGVVVEHGGVLDFAHPLLREAVIAITPVAVRAQLHARIARALEARSQTTTATRTRAAHHWRLAGPAFARQAWRATTRAADAAHDVFAHAEEADLLAQALASLELDPGAPAGSRFELLERQGLALRWAGRPEAAARVQGEAFAAAEATGDRELILRAVRARGQGVLWDAIRYAEPDGEYSLALARLLRRLGDEESALRALTLASLACETYYVAPPDRIDGWAAEALALSERLGDEDLKRDVQGRALGARWRPDTAVERHAVATAMAESARGSRDVRSRALAGCWELILETELGNIDAARSLYRPLRHLVDDNHLSALSPSLDLFEASWAAQAGQHDVARRSLTRVQDHARSAGSSHLARAATALGVVNAALAGDADTVMATYGALGGIRREVPGHTAAAGLLLRVGEIDKARDIFTTHGAEVGRPIYVALFNSALAAELALAFDDTATAAHAYDYLRPFAGRPASSGATGYIGPVDAYLALASQALGRPAEASAHADAALALCSAWEIPAVADWLLGWRDRAGF